MKMYTHNPIAEPHLAFGALGPLPVFLEVGADVIQAAQALCMDLPDVSQQ